MNHRSTGRPHVIRTFKLSDGRLGCAECCNGDRCDDPTHYSRENCPYCKGTGLAPEQPLVRGGSQEPKE